MPSFPPASMSHPAPEAGPTVPPMAVGQPAGTPGPNGARAPAPVDPETAVTDSGRARLLVIDGDAQMRHLLRFTLHEGGYAVREADSGHAGLLQAAHHAPSLVITELRLPDMPGMDVLRRLREWSSTPVLILSAFSQEHCKVAALDAGADDYLTKPFGGGELLARVRVLLRRARPAEVPNLIRFGSVEVDLVHRRVRKAGEIMQLTAREYALLHLLVTNGDRVLTHRQILRELWGPKAENQTHYLRVFMMRLRRKLEDDVAAPKYLRTEAGIGYRLITDQA